MKEDTLRQTFARGTSAQSIGRGNFDYDTIEKESGLILRSSTQQQQTNIASIIRSQQGNQGQ